MSGRPGLVVCMGVSGCGKSTLARALAEAYGLVFIEADDLHGAENRAHMAAGRPLSDAMREPWIRRLGVRLQAERERGSACTLAFSGLRRAHRERLRELGFATLFLHLVADPAVIADRMARRRGHYMPVSLLDSQFADLQPTDDEADVVTLDTGRPFADVLAAASAQLRVFLERANPD